MAWPRIVCAKDPPPPDYAVPAPPGRKFAAARARVVVVDARPADRDAQKSTGEASDEQHLSTRRLGRALEKALTEALGQGKDELVFRVKLVEGREVSESPPKVRAVLDISVERDGQTLASTRGDSTLVGRIGGMSPRLPERIRGAIVDAFERSVLREGFIKPTNAALARAPHAPGPAAPARADPAKHEWTIDHDHASAQAHVLSAAIDLGETYSFGARYLHDHIDSGSGLLWGGYGIEARVISADFDRLDAVAALAILRGGFAVEQAYLLEFGFGAGGRDDLRAIGMAGLFITGYYADIGFMGQFFVSPTEELRPLAGLHVAVRVNIPVYLHDASVRCRSPLPCDTTILPGSRLRSERRRRE